MQTVYAHTPEVSGKVMELVEGEKVPVRTVQTARKQREERKAPRRFVVVGSKIDPPPLVASQVCTIPSSSSPRKCDRKLED